MLQNYILLRQKLIAFAQVVCVVLCLYYIYNYHDYNVNWGLWQSLIPTSWTKALDAQLSKVGTLVLIIPIMMIITSRLNPENNYLRITSTMISVMGVLWGVIFGLKNGTLTEYADLKIFTIYHQDNFDRKAALFQETFTALIDKNIMSNMIEKTKYFKDHIEMNFLTDYEPKLKKMPMAEIKEYTNKVYQNVGRLYEEKLKKDKAINEGWAALKPEWNTIFKILVVVAGTVAIYFLWKAIINNNAQIKEHSNITGSIINEAAQTTRDLNTAGVAMQRSVETTGSILQLCTAQINELRFTIENQLQELLRQLQTTDLTNISGVVLQHNSDIAECLKKSQLLSIKVKLLEQFLNETLTTEWSSFLLKHKK